MVWFDERVRCGYNLNRIPHKERHSMEKNLQRTWGLHLPGPNLIHLRAPWSHNRPGFLVKSLIPFPRMFLKKLPRCCPAPTNAPSSMKIHRFTRYNVPDFLVIFTVLSESMNGRIVTEETRNVQTSVQFISP